MRASPRTFISPIAFIAVLIAVIDQLSKWAVLRALKPGESLHLIGDWFRFTLLFNSGAAFSFGEGHTWVFTLIQLFFIIVIAVAAIRKMVPGWWLAVGLAFIAGGALGNVIDRLFRAPAFFVGHVVDFISVGSFAVFNLADSAITCGVVVVLIGIVLEDKKQAKASFNATERDDGTRVRTKQTLNPCTSGDAGAFSDEGEPLAGGGRL